MLEGGKLGGGGMSLKLFTVRWKEALGGSMSFVGTTRPTSCGGNDRDQLLNMGDNGGNAKVRRTVLETDVVKVSNNGCHYRQKS